MINELKCREVGGANTGVGECSLEMAKIIGFFLVGKSFVLTEANLLTQAALQAALIAAAGADLKSNRIYPVHDLLDITDNTSDPTEQTFGYGATVIVQEGSYNWTFPYLTGGICLSNALRKFNGNSTRIIFYDSNGTLFGWRQGNTIVGIPLNQFYSNPWRPATGAAAMNLGVRVNFEPRFINEEIGFKKAEDFSLRSIEGLQNVKLSQSGTQAKPVYKIKANAGCSGLDLYDDFSAAIASAPANWIATNAATGANITVTSVAVDANIKGWTVTLDSADADYPAVGSIFLRLANPSVLKAAGVPGFESLVLTIVNV